LRINFYINFFCFIEVLKLKIEDRKIEESKCGARSDYGIKKRMNLFSSLPPFHI